MCSDPQEKDGLTFACRVCDDCIATRRAGWVARAMAEKAHWPHALCIALSYDDSTPQNRDSAAMFQYDDVRAFIKRVLSASRYVAPGSRVRFLCAGEQGDRNGRCHWHLVLFSDQSLTTLGEISRFGEVLTDPDKFMTRGSEKIRCHWSLWGRGFVTFQEPDQGGMAYVLSYCLKDQFTVAKSRDSARVVKAENFATGVFRMSKKPAIGERWLYDKFARLDAARACMPDLNFKVPDMSGYWHPSGSFRKKSLWALVALNRRALWATGRNAPQWASLVNSCQENEHDMEILNYGQKEEHPRYAIEREAEACVEREARVNVGENARRFRIADTRKKCGSAIPCGQCRLALSDSDLASFGFRKVWREIKNGVRELVTERDGAGAETVPGYVDGHINPLCQYKKGARQREAWPASNV